MQKGFIHSITTAYWIRELLKRLLFVYYIRHSPLYKRQSVRPGGYSENARALFHIKYKLPTRRLLPIVEL